MSSDTVSVGFTSQIVQAAIKNWQIVLAATLVIAIVNNYIIYPFYTSPLANVPGPRLNAMTKWYQVYIDFTKKRTLYIHSLHQKYGPVVRIGPNELSFTGEEPMKVIYGAGTSFYKPQFYDLFIAYGVRPMFAMLNNLEHGERRKTISNVYAKTYIMTPPVEKLIQEKTRDLMARISQQSVSDLFLEYHFLGCDIITRHVYGKSGETFSLGGKEEHTHLLDDIIGQPKSDWIWSTIHFPNLTVWATEPGWFNTLCQTLGFVRKSRFPYTTMREYAYNAAIKYYKEDVGTENESVMSKMVKYHVSQGGDMSDADLAAEGADHFLAGADTTAETLTYLVWQISRPGFQHIQDKLREELKIILYDSTGMPALRPVDKLPYLDAVIKETLRVYPAIPMSEQRVAPPKGATIYGINVPGGTICSLQPYTENRNPRVFPDPEKFDPERWMISHDSEQYKEMNRCMWSFSSGGRMCIGLHLAMAQMQICLAATYRKYYTRIAPNTTDEMMEVDDGITSAGPIAHHCYVEFHDAKDM